MNTGVKYDNRRRVTKGPAEKTRNPTPLPPVEKEESPHGSFHSKMLAQHKQEEAAKTRSPRAQATPE